MVISDLVSPIIYKISNCYNHIFTVSVSVFLCVPTDITGGCRRRCVETSCDAGFKLWILYNQSLTSSVKYSKTK